MFSHMLQTHFGTKNLNVIVIWTRSFRRAVSLSVHYLFFFFFLVLPVWTRCKKNHCESALNAFWSNVHHSVKCTWSHRVELRVLWVSVELVKLFAVKTKLLRRLIKNFVLHTVCLSLFSKDWCHCSVYSASQGCLCGGTVGGGPSESLEWKD